MRRQDFFYELPNELIARQPAKERRNSRLLMLDGPSGELQHKVFADVVDLVEPGDLMVFNNTRVIPARLFGRKPSGGKVEVLVERVLTSHSVVAHIRASKSPKDGSTLILDDTTEVQVVRRHGELFELSFPAQAPALDVMQKCGHMPLPPYIDREDEAVDRERYQTVYASKQGAVAAPTAGLHFDEDIIRALQSKGVQVAFVTLHVGAGTFQPVRVENIQEHQMHSEFMEISAEVCQQVKAAKDAGKRVIAVGTTSVRCLETASQHGDIQPYTGETNIFIYPSYQYRIVDGLITNFHLPESTLLMLVSAFAGYNHVMNAYREAIDNRYRFFSYGDAMFITRNPQANLQRV